MGPDGLEMVSGDLIQILGPLYHVVVVRCTTMKTSKRYTIPHPLDVWTCAHVHIHPEMVRTLVVYH